MVRGKIQYQGWDCRIDMMTAEEHKMNIGRGWWKKGAGFGLHSPQLKPREGIRQCLLLWGAVKPLPSLDSFYKEQKVLRFPETHELSFSFGWKDTRFPWGVGGKGNATTESRRKVQDSHPANSSPSSLGYAIARRWTRKARAVTTALQKPFSEKYYTGS